MPRGFMLHALLTVQTAYAQLLRRINFRLGVAAWHSYSLSREWSRRKNSAHSMPIQSIAVWKEEPFTDRDKNQLLI